MIISLLGMLKIIISQFEFLKLNFSEILRKKTRYFQIKEKIPEPFILVLNKHL